MKSFKQFHDEIHTKVQTKKLGLNHPVKDKSEENEQSVGKELLGVNRSVNVHDEFKGSEGNFVLKVKKGKYSLEKGEK